MAGDIPPGEPNWWRGCLIKVPREATAVVFRSKTLLGFQDGESVAVREVSSFLNDRD